MSRIRASLWVSFAAPAWASWAVVTHRVFSDAGQETFNAALALLLLSLCLLAALAFSGLAHRRATVLPRSRDQRGALTASFALALVPLILILALLVQAALIAHAVVVTQYAVFMAARSAVVAMPDEREWEVSKAAAMCLVPISPVSDSASAYPRTGAAMGSIARRNGLPWSYRGADGRLAYALNHSTVRVDSPWHTLAGDVTVSLSYDFALTIPLASSILADSRTRIAGRSRPTLRLPSSCTLYTTGDRYHGLVAYSFWRLYEGGFD